MIITCCSLVTEEHTISIFLREHGYLLIYLQENKTFEPKRPRSQFRHLEHLISSLRVYQKFKTRVEHIRIRPCIGPMNLLTYSMEQSPFSEANWFCSQSRNSPHFMEPESSSPYSQVPAICPYPEPTPSSLHPLPLREDPN